MAAPETPSREGPERPGGGPLHWALHMQLPRQVRHVLAWTLAGLVLLFGAATYAALSGLPPFDGGGVSIITLLYADLFLLLVLAVFIVYRIVGLWVAHRRGSRLHVRLAFLFSVLSVAPAIIVSTFSLLFFDLGVESWFSERVRTALSESRSVAEAYLREHQSNISIDALRMARDLSLEAPLLDASPRLMARALDIHFRVRDLTEAIIFTPAAGVRARAGLTFALELESLPGALLDRARDGDVALLSGQREDRVRALIKLENFSSETFLIVGRYVDARVLARMQATRDAVEQFEKLEQGRFGVKTSFMVAFLVVSLLLLVLAVWMGLNFASRLTRPLGALTAAADRIRAGDLSARVAEAARPDEFGQLSRTFNRMTHQLAAQRSELVRAARVNDERRLFTEAVLSGVSAGVLGLDAARRVNLPNRSALRLLGLARGEIVDRPVTGIIPSLEPLLARAARDGAVEAEVEFGPAQGMKTFLVRITAERAQAPDAATPAAAPAVTAPEATSPDMPPPAPADGAGAIVGYVVTFDDISDLLAAQRKAAWSDVARRIAHEIKNPLTPIQLAAERLQRRHGRQAPDDAGIFRQCTDTIIRQVEVIGRMVEAFSSFARMPKPVMKPCDLSDLCRRALFLQRSANPHITYAQSLPAAPVIHTCDEHQISQAVINVLKNAAESIDAAHGADAEEKAEKKGRITLSLSVADGMVAIGVRDTGRGLPHADGGDLTEPYVTTRASGTGLGLAIVRNIMEDHGGRVTLENADGAGAIVRLEMPWHDAAAGTNEADASA